LTNSIDRVGTLTKEAAEQFGLLEGTPVMGGAGDTASAAVGSGAVGEGKVISVLERRPGWSRNAENPDREKRCCCYSIG